MNTTPNKTTNPFQRIAINTGGGDAPGLNAVIHAAVHAAHTHDWQIHGIRDGFDGLLHPENYPDGGVMKLTRPLVCDIAHLGGTILGTSNHGNPFKQRAPQPDGSFAEVDRSDEVLRRFRERRLDALISVGGDGSLNIARDLHKKDCASSACHQFRGDPDRHTESPPIRRHKPAGRWQRRAEPDECAGRDCRDLRLNESPGMGQAGDVDKHDRPVDLYGPDGDEFPCAVLPCSPASLRSSRTASR